MIGILLSTLATLIYIYYVYLNFSDMEDLESQEKPSYRAGKPRDPLLAVILMFVFAPLTFYLKYDQLYTHFETYHPDSQNLPPSPMKMIVTKVVFLLLPLYSCVNDSVWNELMDRNWQFGSTITWFHRSRTILHQIRSIMAELH